MFFTSLFLAHDLQTAEASENNVTVVSTIYPLADIVDHIGGAAVTSQTLLPPGASPHTFEPRPGDVRNVATASLFVSIGAGLDDWATGIARATDQQLTMLDLSELIRDSEFVLTYDEIALGGLRADDDHDHPIDPHFWLDPIIVRDMIAPQLAKLLTSLIPEEADAIIERLNAYQMRLTALDKRVKDRLHGLTTNKFISYHAAWGYYAKRYGLDQVASVTPFPGQEPSARWLADLILLARREKVDVVFAEPQLNRKAADTIAKEINGTVIVLDPIGGKGVANRESYIDLIEYNTESLAAVLGGRG